MEQPFNFYLKVGTYSKRLLEKIPTSVVNDGAFDNPQLCSLVKGAWIQTVPGVNFARKKVLFFVRANVETASN